MPRLLFFHYDNGSRSQKVAVRLLKNFKGYLQSDGHPIYDAFEDREDVCLCGCLAHIRRHIELCKEENPEYAMQGLKFIQDMYNVEYMADKQELPYENVLNYVNVYPSRYLTALNFGLKTHTLKF